jgi:hypothetical protein
MSSESKISRDNKTGEVTTTPSSTSTSVTTFNLTQLFDNADENLTKFVNEFSKAQPEYAQAISNLQQEYIDTAKDSIKIGTSVQKQLINSNRFSNTIIPATTTAPSIQQLVNQSNDFTNNIIRITENNNQFVINALNATKENLKNNRRVLKAAAEYSASVCKSVGIINFITSESIY